MANSYSLFELNEFIRRVLALNLPEAIWVQAEIAQVKGNRGHFFLTLVQKATETDELLAQSEAVIWERTFRRIQRQAGTALRDILQEGMAIKVLVRVDFNERYGLKLTIEDIDPNFTLGELERQKRATLEKLSQEGLLALNASLALPPVLQRIAVLSSPEAAGLKDFEAQLRNNAYGYAFHYTLFPTAVQGAQVWPEMQKQLKKIRRLAHRFDCLVLIRGGGSRTDLAAFDQYPLCAALAAFPLPLITGIGHEIDETITDRIAHLALKTPTAVAEYLISQNLLFENRLHETGLRIQQAGQQQLRGETLLLEKLQQHLFFKSRQMLEDQRLRLEKLNRQLPLLFRSHLQKSHFELEKMEQSIRLLHPEYLLKRGYSLTYFNGELVRSVNDVPPGAQIQTRLADGQLTSQIVKKEKKH